MADVFTHGHEEGYQPRRERKSQPRTEHAGRSRKLLIEGRVELANVISLQRGVPGFELQLARDGPRSSSERKRASIEERSSRDRRRHLSSRSFGRKLC